MDDRRWHLTVHSGLLLGQIGPDTLDFIASILDVEHL